MAQLKTLTPKLLGAGLLKTTVETLYRVPTEHKRSINAGIRARIKTIVLVNKHTTSNLSLNLYVDNGTGKRHIIPVDLQLFPGFMLVHDDELILGPGDSILGSAGTADYIDFTIHGIEEYIK
tara:strand:+ start:41 stop:406 length:366 start_codon:yes stop_codon:yes gene_type:complete